MCDLLLNWGFVGIQYIDVTVKKLKICDLDIYGYKNFFILILYSGLI